MEMLKESSCFTTSDIYLASTLAALGFPVVGLDRQDTNRNRFIFENSSILQQVVEDFWNHKLAVEPQLVFSHLRSLRWRLHET
jgi:hypothetical protein